MRVEPWFVVTTVECGTQLHTCSSMKKLISYFTKKLKYTISDIKEATREDYNKHFNITKE